MAREYDVIVIGAGSAGTTVASSCRKAGMDTAIVEARDYGGTCPLRGCNPKKVLVNAAAAVARTSDLCGKGINSAAKLNWPDLIRFKRSFTDPRPPQIEGHLRSQGIHTFHGRARFVGKNSIEVKEEVLKGKYIFISTGMVPQKLGFPGEEHVTISEQFMELESLPEVITFIGGGYISFEFAHVAARAGSKAVILHRSERPLKRFDQEMVGKLVELSMDLGIDIHLNMPVRAVERQGEQLIVRAGKNGEHRFISKMVVHGAGRVADIDALDLKKGEVAADESGITVNESLQSVSNPAVYAGGDVAATPFPLTPVADLHGGVAANNIIAGENTQTVNYTGIPSVVFAIPPLASVGFNEEELKAQGRQYHKVIEDTSTWFSSQSIGLKHSYMKVLVSQDSQRVLGAHLLSHRAEEVINFFGLAMRLNLTVDELKRAVWTYPSFTSDILTY